MWKFGRYNEQKCENRHFQQAHSPTVIWLSSGDAENARHENAGMEKAGKEKYGKPYVK